MKLSTKYIISGIVILIFLSINIINQEIPDKYIVECSNGEKMEIDIYTKYACGQRVIYDPNNGELTIYSENTEIDRNIEENFWERLNNAS